MIESAITSLSIIICTRNSEKTIGRCFESIKIDERIAYEIILIDGQSNDSTLEVVNMYGAYHSIKIISSPAKGVYNAMNIGIRNSNLDYDFLYFLHSDDEMISKSFNEFVMKAFEKINLGSAVFYSDIKYVKTSGEIVSSKENAFTKKICTLSHPACLFTKDIYMHMASSQVYDESYRISSDALLFYALKQKNIPFVKIECESIVKMHDGGLSSHSKISDQFDLYKIESKHIGVTRAARRLIWNIIYSILFSVKSAFFKKYNYAKR